jgi:hypothetical protein
MEGKGREGKGREGKGREGKGREKVIFLARLNQIGQHGDITG